MSPKAGSTLHNEPPVLTCLLCGAHLHPKKGETFSQFERRASKWYENHLKQHSQKEVAEALDEEDVGDDD